MLGRIYMNIKSLGFAAGLLLMAGCSSDERVLELQDITGDGMKTFTSFTAVLNGVADSRAYIVDGTENGPKQVTWDDGDVIEIFSELQWDATMYELQSISENEGTFVGKEVSGKKFTAVYAPLGWSRDYVNRNKVYFYVGEALDEHYWEETAHATTVLDFEFCAPMLATSETNDLHFKQLTGMIHFTISGLRHISNAYFKGNNGERIQGTFYVDLSDLDGGLQVDDSKDYATQTKVYLDEESLDEGQTMDVYFALPPTVFEEGFTLGIEGEDFDYNDLYLEKTFTDKLVLKAGEVKHFSLVNMVAELDKVHVAKMQEQLEALNDPTTANALLALYQQTGGPYWEVYGWGRDDDIPVDNWEGLVFEDGKLVEIWLTSINMQGALPAEIGDLTDLRALVLEYNQITSLPAELSKLTNLKELDLYSNELSGELPAVIANMPNLEELYLSRNDFEGSIPDSWLNNLSNLKSMDLGQNKLSGNVTKAQQESPMWQSLVANDLGFLNTLANQKDGYGIIVDGWISNFFLTKNEYKLTVGETAQLDITILPEGDLSNLKIQSYGSAISVDENGKITALSQGRSSIEISANDGYGTAAKRWCEVNVYASAKEGANEDFEDDEEQGYW